MKLQGNTVLITGGSSGIGFELASQLLMMGNTILICGRSKEKLASAKKKHPSIHTFQCDISSTAGRNQLYEWVKEHFSKCNILVNNAAIVHKTDFFDDPAILDKAEDEIQTNLVAPIVLSKLFAPIISTHPHSAIINITTGLVYAPRAVYPIYNATKAGLHSFTQVIRYQAANRPSKIVEVLMPVVDTPWHKGNAPKMAISPEVAVSKMIRNIEAGKLEIRIGASNKLYWLSRFSPYLAFRLINRM